jgi:hypothetical protein
MHVSNKMHVSLKKTVHTISWLSLNININKLQGDLSTTCSSHFSTLVKQNNDKIWLHYPHLCAAALSHATQIDRVSVLSMLFINKQLSAVGHVRRFPWAAHVMASPEIEHNNCTTHMHLYVSHREGWFILANAKENKNLKKVISSVESVYSGCHEQQHRL